MIGAFFNDFTGPFYAQPTSTLSARRPLTRCGHWKNIGCPEYIDKPQAAALVRESLQAEAEDGSVAVRLSLPPMGIALVTLYL